MKIDIHEIYCDAQYPKGPPQPYEADPEDHANLFNSCIQNQLRGEGSPDEVGGTLLSVAGLLRCAALDCSGSYRARALY